MVSRLKLGGKKRRFFYPQPKLIDSLTNYLLTLWQNDWTLTINYQHREVPYTSPYPEISNPICPLIAPRCYIHLRWRFCLLVVVVSLFLDKTPAWWVSWRHLTSWLFEVWLSLRGKSWLTKPVDLSQLSWHRTSRRLANCNRKKHEQVLPWNRLNKKSRPLMGNLKVEACWVCCPIKSSCLKKESWNKKLFVETTSQS